MDFSMTVVSAWMAATAIAHEGSFRLSKKARMTGLSAAAPCAAVDATGWEGCEAEKFAPARTYIQRHG